jgi:stress-induced morphogen
MVPSIHEWRNLKPSWPKIAKRNKGVPAMPMNPGDIEDMIKEGIPGAKVVIRDLAGDGDHYAAEVVAEAFRGKSRVQQHQMVYNALKGNMGGVLHALALQTSAPD